MKRLILAVLMAIAALPAPAAFACLGDCGDDGSVTVDEILTGVSVALGNAVVDLCPLFDSSGEGDVTVDEILGAVTNALNGCPDFTGPFSGTITLESGQSGFIELTVEANGHASGTVRLNDSAGAGSGGGAGAVLSAVTGDVDPDTGAFSVSGTYMDGTQTLPLEISGRLPGFGGTSSITARLGSQTWAGSLTYGIDSATPTPTSMPTTPGTTPTPAPGCEGGTATLTFANAVGTNSREGFDAPAYLTKATATFSTITFPGGGLYTFGGVLNKCPIEVNGTTRGVSWGIADNMPMVVGKAYQLNQSAAPGLPKSSLGYNEAFTVGQLIWTATSGTLTIDSISENSVTFHVDNAAMQPGAPFPIGPPAMGSFTMTVQATVTEIMRISN